METYTILRHFADSWMLLFLFWFYLGVFSWVMRPGSRSEYEQTADIPFRYENQPAPKSEQ